MAVSKIKSKKNKGMQSKLAKFFSKRTNVVFSIFVLGFALYGSYMVFTSSAAMTSKGGYSTFSPDDCAYGNFRPHDRGVCIKVAQNAFNYQVLKGGLAGPYLTVDGIYGEETYYAFWRVGFIKRDGGIIRWEVIKEKCRDSGVQCTAWR